MKRNQTKLAMREEIVKYIFPASNPTILEAQGGYIIYDFRKLYPAKLGVFVPNEVGRSNYSSFFPKSFESYFSNMHEQAAYLSRFLEVKIEPTMKNQTVECLPGCVLPWDKPEHTLFRFDESVDPRRKTEVLCRARIRNLTEQEKLDILAYNPIFRGDSIAITGEQYVYWIMAVTQLFKIDIEVLATIIAFANSLRITDGPIF